MAEKRVKCDCVRLFLALYRSAEEGIEGSFTHDYDKTDSAIFLTEGQISSARAEECVSEEEARRIREKAYEAKEFLKKPDWDEIMLRFGGIRDQIEKKFQQITKCK